MDQWIVQLARTRIPRIQGGKNRSGNGYAFTVRCRQEMVECAGEKKGGGLKANHVVDAEMPTRRLVEEKR